MIELIDQSNPDKLVFHCDRCGRNIEQPNWTALDLHIPGPWTPGMLTAMKKARIPLCEPLPPRVAPTPEPVVETPRPRGRPRKVVET
jgi:hypothetical protein